jgi:hypothetical protein
LRHLTPNSPKGLVFRRANRPAPSARWRITPDELGTAWRGGRCTRRNTLERPPVCAIASQMTFISVSWIAHPRTCALVPSS